MKIKVVDFKPSPVCSVGRGAWTIYAVTIEHPDGRQQDGEMQGDGHLWAEETFEANHLAHDLKDHIQQTH